MNNLMKRFTFNKLLLYVTNKPIFHLLSDETFLKLKYRLIFHEKLDLDNPKTYSQKLQWLKLYYRKREFSDMVDKVKVRDIVKSKIGAEYLIPLLGTWEKFDDIDFDLLPNQFVLKPNHTSGDVYICKDKSKINYEELRSTVNAWLARKYYKGFREWPYKNVKPCILAEEYMVDESGTELKDYKFFCFDGVAKALFVATDRGVDTRFDFYDTEFNHLPFKNGHEHANKKIVKPQNFEKMLELAEVLSKGYPHLRVDFYNVNGRIYFGELTFFHWSGLKPFDPEEWDRVFGDWIVLPEKCIED